VKNVNVYLPGQGASIAKDMFIDFALGSASGSQQKAERLLGKLGSGSLLALGVGCCFANRKATAGRLMAL